MLSKDDWVHWRVEPSVVLSLGLALPLQLQSKLATIAAQQKHGVNLAIEPYKLGLPDYDESVINAAKQDKRIIAFWHSAAGRADVLRDSIRGELSKIVSGAAWSQSLKGVITAGPIRAGVYSLAKVQKWIQAVIRFAPH
jgi:hypothetical protein